MKKPTICLFARSLLAATPLAASLLAVCLAGPPLLGAPKLRLSSAAVGPVDIAVGQDGPVQSVVATNAGDGALSLTVASPHPWLSPSVASAAACQSGTGVCVPVRIALKTADLARGVHTGAVTVSDPGALDAPQTITVTVQIGGGVPDQAVLFVPPGGTDGVAFRTTTPIALSTSTQTGGQWLSLAMDGGGSFPFAVPYRVAARDPGALAEGVYSGQVNVTASGFQPDVKTVPVTMRVTREPIAALSASSIEYKLAAGTRAAERYVSTSNRGLGVLSITGVSAATEDGAAWLAAELVSGLVKVTADPGALAPGLYQGEVTVESNAANSPQVVAVRFHVTAQAPPVAGYGGVVNNATFSANDPIPLGGIAAVFGEQLSYQSPAIGSELPLVTELGGARVRVNGVEAPLFYSSEGQINFQMPYETPPGEARVEIVRGGLAGNTVTVQVTAKNPRILTFLGDYAIAVNTDGTFPVPATPGIDTRPARPGDVLVMYAIGFGATVPPVPTGAAAAGDPLSYVLPMPTILLGGGLLPVRVTPDFVGLTPTYVGLYQINFTIPGNVPRGDRVRLLLEGPGYVTNQVEIAIE